MPHRHLGVDKVTVASAGAVAGDITVSLKLVNYLLHPSDTQAGRLSNRLRRAVRLTGHKNQQTAMVRKDCPFPFFHPRSPSLRASQYPGSKCTSIRMLRPGKSCNNPPKVTLRQGDGHEAQSLGARSQEPTPYGSSSHLVDFNRLAVRGRKSQMRDLARRHHQPQQRDALEACQ